MIVLKTALLDVRRHWTFFWRRGRRVYFTNAGGKRPAVAESAMRHAFLHHPRHHEKSGPISHRHGSVSELYGRFTVIRSPPVNRPTPHFMSSWKCPAHIRSAICMLRCFSRTTTMACSNVRSEGSLPEVTGSERCCSWSCFSLCGARLSTRAVGRARRFHYPFL